MRAHSSTPGAHAPSLRSDAFQPRATRFGPSGAVGFRTALVFVAFLASAFPAWAEDVGERTLVEALKEGEATVDLRYRFEFVDQDGFDEEAEASTLRTTLSYRTGTWRGWSVFVEAEDVTAVPDDDTYRNAGRDGAGNDVFDRPVVADPDLTQVNQAYVRWQGGGWGATLGRQEINLGDHRFVGNVGWRQNHQSFDALRVRGEIGRARPDYSFVESVERIFGDSLDSEHHLLWIPIELDGQALTPYAFLLDYDGPAALSRDTYGVEWKGTAGAWGWEAEWATQSDAGDNPNEVDADYLRGYASYDLSDKGGAVTLALDAEILEGAPGRGQFLTPLATLHKWNGFADIFLTTPQNGLETLKAQVSGGGKTDAGSWSWLLAFLDHSAESGDADYGTEIDGLLTWKHAGSPLGLGLKLALYDADDFGADTDKIMLFGTYRFGG